MNLVCFTNYTAGGLICDLLNNTNSGFEGSIVKYNVAHHMMNVEMNYRGVQRVFDETKWNVKQSECDSLNLPDNFYVGTHCHPSVIPDKYLQNFNEVLNITTETKESKWYRFLRYYHIELEQNHWKNISGRIGDPTEVAKNVREAFEKDNRCTNVEFADIVNGKFMQDRNIVSKQIDEWKKINHWLYNPVSDNLVKCFDSFVP